MLRYEIKYALSPSRADLLAELLAPHTQADRYGAEYAVHSLYFDTPGLEAYHEKLAGLPVRTKLRIRTYDTGSPAFLETKRRVQGKVAKERIRLPDAAGGWVDGVEALRAARSLAPPAGLLRAILRPGLLPLVRVSYHRRAWVARGPGRIRVTLDRRLGARSASGLRAGPVSPSDRRMLGGQSVLELKWAGPTPDWMRGVITRLGLQRAAISKFAEGLEAICPLAEERRSHTASDEGLSALSGAILYLTAARRLEATR